METLRAGGRCPPAVDVGCWMLDVGCFHHGSLTPRRGAARRQSRAAPFWCCSFGIFRKAERRPAPRVVRVIRVRRGESRVLHRLAHAVREQVGRTHAFDELRVGRPATVILERLCLHENLIRGECGAGERCERAQDFFHGKMSGAEMAGALRTRNKCREKTTSRQASSRPVCPRPSSR